jgi:hypothetical protein
MTRGKKIFLNNLIKNCCSYLCVLSYKQKVILILIFTLSKLCMCVVFSFLYSFSASILSNHIHNLIVTSCYYQRQFALKTNILLVIMHKMHSFYFLFSSLFFVRSLSLDFLTCWCTFFIEYVYKYTPVSDIEILCTIFLSITVRQLKWNYFTR